MTENFQTSKKKYSFPALMARAFIKNTALTWLIIVSSIGLAIFSYIASPKNNNPEIEIAKFNFQISYPNATAEEVDKFVGREMEQIVSNISGVESIEITSFDGGMASIDIEFKPGQNVSDIKSKVLTELQIVYARLQSYDLPAMIVQSLDSKNARMITFGFTSDHLSADQLRAKVIKLRDAIKQNISGLATPLVTGGERKIIRIQPDPGKMKVSKIDLHDINQVLQAANLRTQVGTLKNNLKNTQVQVGGTFKDITDIENLEITRKIRLKDIAEVRYDFHDEENFIQVYSREKGLKNAVFLSFGKVKGQNTVSIAQQTRDFVKDQMSTFSWQDVDYFIYRDESIQATQSTSDLTVNLAQTIGIVFVILLLFLQFRPASNVAISIPLILGITVIVGYAMGKDINSVYLAGFILALGILVDAATVITESIYNKLESGLDRLKAVMEGVDAVGNGLVISTLTSIIVFLPLFMVSGEMGEFQRPFAFVLPISLTISLFVAFSIGPFLAYKILQDPGDNCCQQNIFSLAIGWMNQQYKKILTWILYHKARQYFYLLFVLFLLVFSFTLAATGAVRQTGNINSEITQFALYVDTPIDTPVEKTQEIVQQIVPKLDFDPRVKSIQVYTAAEMVGAMRGAISRTDSHQASIRIGVYSKSEAPPSALEYFPKDVVNTFREKFNKDFEITSLRQKGIKIWFVEYPGGVSPEAPLEIEIKGPNRSFRLQALHDLQNIVKESKSVTFIETSHKDLRERITYHIDPDKALASGLSNANIHQAFSLALSDQEIGQFHTSQTDEIINLEMGFDKSKKNQIQDLSQIYLRNPSGKMIPLDTVTKISYQKEHPTLLRRDLKPMDRLIAFTNGDSGELTSEIMEKVKNYHFPQGKLIEKTKYGFKYKLANGQLYEIFFRGDFKQNYDIQSDFAGAIIVALIAVYIVLVYQFRSFKIPFVIMSTIPLGFIGIFISFTILWLLFGIYFDTGGLVGILALIGIVVNNSILILEAYDQFRQEGLSVREALIEACNQRYRPIMLTSLTTSIGILTLLTSDLWRSLSLVIATGLIVSVTITLFLIPVLYHLMYGYRGKS